MDTPEQVIARVERDVEAMRRRGFVEEARRLSKVVAEFALAIKPIRLVPEHTAVARSGKRVRWLRERHADLCKVGGAGFDEDGARLYRLCALPTRLHAEEGVAEAERILEAS